MNQQNPIVKIFKYRMNISIRVSHREKVTAAIHLRRFAPNHKTVIKTSAGTSTAQACKETGFLMLKFRLLNPGNDFINLHQTFGNGTKAGGRTGNSGTVRKGILCPDNVFPL